MTGDFSEAERHEYQTPGQEIKMEVILLGHIIGTSEGWNEAGDWGDVQFNFFIPNELGKKFLQREFFTEDQHLVVYLSSGKVELYTPNIEVIEIIPDWSVFNKENNQL